MRPDLSPFRQLLQAKQHSDGATTLDPAPSVLCDAKELVDGPLVVGMLAVLRSDHATVAADEEVGRQSEATAARSDRRRWLTTACDCEQAA